MDDVLEALASWRAAGKGVALATVVSTWGSSPRPAGSQLGIREDGEMVGSVSGGCVEGAVVEAARALLDAGGMRVLEFGVSNEAAWEVGLACGGRIRVLVESVGAGGGKAEVLDALLAARRAKRVAVLVTDLDGGSQELLFPLEASDSTLAVAARSAVLHDRSELLSRDGRELFLQVFPPSLRLVVVGAVHIAQALVPIARSAGMEVAVVDPRRAFATASRFPGVPLLQGWPDAALRELELDARSAVVALSHDAKLDDPALAAALGSPAFYVGALGSRKTQAARRERLRERGFSAADLDRIHGPVGLDIGARTAPEIALSIVAEIIQTLRRPEVS